MTTPSYIYSTLKPPPIESLAVAYLGPLVTPLRVLTRIPPNNPNADTPDGNTFIRVEASAGTLMPGSILYNVQTILHSYAPYNEEITAEDNIGTALAWMGNAQGNTITAAGYDWYITYSTISSLGHRMTDPETPLARYRGAVMWRVAGQPIAGISSP